MYHRRQWGAVELVATTGVVSAILCGIVVDDWSQAGDKQVLGID
jgi:hypothetical protein